MKSSVIIKRNFLYGCCKWPSRRFDISILIHDADVDACGNNIARLRVCMRWAKSWYIDLGISPFGGSRISLFSGFCVGNFRNWLAWTTRNTITDKYITLVAEHVGSGMISKEAPIMASNRITCSI